MFVLRVVIGVYLISSKDQGNSYCIGEKSMEKDIIKSFCCNVELYSQNEHWFCSKCNRDNCEHVGHVFDAVLSGGKIEKRSIN